MNQAIGRYGAFGASYAPGFALNSTDLLPGEKVTTLEGALNAYTTQRVGGGYQAAPVSGGIDSVLRIGSPANKAAEAQLAASQRPAATRPAAPASAYNVPAFNGGSAPYVPAFNAPSTGETSGDDTFRQVLTGVAVGSAFLLTVGVLVRLVRY